MYTYVYTRTYTYINTYIRIYIYTYMYIYTRLSQECGHLCVARDRCCLKCVVEKARKSFSTKSRFAKEPFVSQKSPTKTRYFPQNNSTKTDQAVSTKGKTSAAGQGSFGESTWRTYFTKKKSPDLKHASQQGLQGCLGEGTFSFSNRAVTIEALSPIEP